MPDRFSLLSVSAMLQPRLWMSILYWLSYSLRQNIKGVFHLTKIFEVVFLLLKYLSLKLLDSLLQEVCISGDSGEAFALTGLPITIRNWTLKWRISTPALIKYNAQKIPFKTYLRSSSIYQNISGRLPFTKVFEVVFNLHLTKIFEVVFLLLKYLSLKLLDSLLQEVCISGDSGEAFALTGLPITIRNWTLKWRISTPALIKYNAQKIPFKTYLRSSSIYQNISGRLPFTKVFEVVFNLQKYLRLSCICE